MAISQLSIKHNVICKNRPHVRQTPPSAQAKLPQLVMRSAQSGHARVHQHVGAHPTEPTPHLAPPPGNKKTAVYLTNAAEFTKYKWWTLDLECLGILRV